MINIFGTDFIEVKNESVSINITTLETGQKLYSVSGGIKNGTRLKTKEFKTPNECIDENIQNIPILKLKTGELIALYDVLDDGIYVLIMES
jgi:hypothetical protein